MRLSVGDMVFEVEDTRDGGIPEILKPFVVSSDTPEIVCTAATGDYPTPEGGCLYDPGYVWRLHGHEDGYNLVILANGNPCHCLRLDPSLTRGEITFFPPLPLENETPFLLREPMFELWTSFLLMRGRGILVHGLGISREGNGIVFAGPSGVGKSTLGKVVAKMGGFDILSDDRLILRRHGDHFRVYGTPWHGEASLSCAGSVRLTHLYFLKQASRPRIIPMSLTDSASRLFANCFVAGWPRDEGIQNTMDICANVGMLTACAELEFTPDDRTLRHLDLR